jgi:oligopeptide/dipeptide ABC transporter ATP-binding protein
MSDSVLSVRDLSTTFVLDGVRARAVDRVSFDVRPGETLGLVGESGCGKTVTSLTILGLLPDDAEIGAHSSVVFRSRKGRLHELIGARRKELERIRGNEISMVFQEPMSSLNPLHTVGEQIAEPLRRHRRLGAESAMVEAVRLLAEVGIPEPATRIREYPHQLSGGMRQRVMIAMALACEPVLLIADEPTTALDVTIQAQILKLLGDLRARRDMSVLLITHDLAVVAEVCDRVAVMYAGQVVETGSVEGIFADPRHPYTRGLLGALPSSVKRGTRLEAIPGTVPSPTDVLEGCRFRDRCSLSTVGCDREQDLIRLEAGRFVRCWRTPKVSRPIRGRRA